MLFSPNPNNARSVMHSVQMKSEDARGLNVLAKAIPLWAATWGGQFVRFGLVGILNTLIDASVYFLLARSILASQLILAKAISYSVGIVNSFFWNKSWTFRSHLKSRQVFLPFIAANLLAVGLNAWVMHLALDGLSLPEFGALILATAVTFVWNFIVNKLLIFR